MRILVVEDEHKIANSIRKGLEQEHFVVDAVYTGQDGLDYAFSEEYDAIVMDRMLPGIDGLAITQKIRAKQIHTPVLMLTARGQIEERVAGLDSGADDYLVKPFAFTELLARVRALTRRPKHVNSTVLVVGDISLNPLSFEVNRGGVPVQLSGKEFALLEYLMRHAGKIISKEQIISHVWNYDSDVLPNSVEVYIKHLRKKVDSFDDKPPLIKTVRGFGYRIGGE